MPGVPSLSSSMPWVKLWNDFLDDPKIGMLPDSAQLFFVKLLALAGESDAEGYLVNGEAALSVRQIAWRFRMTEQDAQSCIDQLIEAGLAAWDEGYLLVVNFSKRQGRSQMSKREKWAEWQRTHRTKKAQSVINDNGDVMPDNVIVIKAEEEEEKEEEKEEEEEVESRGDWIPKHPKEAMKHPDIQVYQAVSERIPGIGQYDLVIQTVQLLRQKIPEEAALVAYLSPFWLAWSGRKTKNGRPYDASSLVWLTEWAVNDHIPPAYRENGNGPPREYTAEAKKKAAQAEYQRQLAELEAQSDES